LQEIQQRHAKANTSALCFGDGAEIQLVCMAWWEKTAYTDIRDIFYTINTLMITRVLNCGFYIESYRRSYWR
jgi:hypothetical protein